MVRRMAPLQYRPRTRRQRATGYIRARRPKRNDLKRYAKKAGLGTAAGLAVSIPLTLAGRHYKQPILIEAGQRIGSIASTAVGGTPGNAAYQAADAVFDRFVMYQGQSISGSQGQVYL